MGFGVEKRDRVRARERRRPVGPQPMMRTGVWEGKGGGEMVGGILGGVVWCGVAIGSGRRGRCVLRYGWGVIMDQGGRCWIIFKQPRRIR